jgi:predicted acylesterase/phospholipase RssA
VLSAAEVVSQRKAEKNRWHDALPKPVAFVFSGGAALGAIQVGMLRALTAVNLQPDLIVAPRWGR